MISVLNSYDQFPDHRSCLDVLCLHLCQCDTFIDSYLLYFRFAISIQENIHHQYQVPSEFINTLYLYLNHPPGTAFAPLQREFLRFVLSREGQSLVLRDGYVPLPAKVAARERLRVP